jgi:hypothetical protein
VEANDHDAVPWVQFVGANRNDPVLQGRLEAMSNRVFDLTGRDNSSLHRKFHVLAVLAVAMAVPLLEQLLQVRDGSNESSVLDMMGP